MTLSHGHPTCGKSRFSNHKNLTTMSIWRRILGLSTKPIMPEPESGHLHRLDDDNCLYIHRVVTADYNLYSEQGIAWFTIRISADPAENQSDEPITSPWLEISITTLGRPDPVLTECAYFPIPAYTSELGNLTNVFYYTHGSLEDGVLVIERITANGIVIRISGSSDDDPIVVRCIANHNAALKRSIQ